MVDSSTRRLPNWLAVGGEDKKKTAVESPTLPRNSVSPVNNGTKRKKVNLPQAVSRGGNRRKRKAKNVDKEIEDEDALTVEDLVSIAQEYVVKESEDSEPSPLLSYSNDLQGSNEQQQFSRAPIASTTVNLTSEQSFSSFTRTDDPAQDMLNLLLGPLLGMKPPQRNEMNLDLQKQESEKNYFREETLPPIPLTKKKSSLKDKVSFLLD